MKRKTMSKGDSLRNQIRNHKVEDKKISTDDSKSLWVPSGSILFNLACSNNYKGAYKTGTMINIIGDSSAGKSIMVLSGLAETANNKKFDNYRLIYDDAEYANSFDMQKLFGSKLSERIEGPYEDPTQGSISIEQFSDTIHTELDKGQPIIYVLDSFDAIDSDDEIKKEADNRESRIKGNLSKVKGTYGATKQKKASQIFRQICSKLKKTQSLLIIISQTRDNLNALSFEKKYRAGGRALKFYASIEAWLAGKSSLTKTKNKVLYKIGGQTLAKIEKNKYTGKKREALFPIFYDYGIDDITACIDFLLSNEYWDIKKNTIIVPEYNLECSKIKLVEQIESLGTDKLFKATGTCWNEIEASLELNRRSKFE